MRITERRSRYFVWSYLDITSCSTMVCCDWLPSFLALPVTSCSITDPLLFWLLTGNMHQLWNLLFSISCWSLMWIASFTLRVYVPIRFSFKIRNLFQSGSRPISWACSETVGRCASSGCGRLEYPGCPAILLDRAFVHRSGGFADENFNAFTGKPVNHTVLLETRWHDITSSHATVWNRFSTN